MLPVIKEKYFTPEIEELFIGYECSIDTMTGLKFGIFPELLQLNKNLNQFGNDDFMKAAHAILKTPYLTKEQIEAEGWDFKFNMIDLWFEKEISFKKVSQNPCKATLHYNLNDKWMFIYLQSYGEKIHIFQGKIKCINEFRNILKYLCINT